MIESERKILEDILEHLERKRITGVSIDSRTVKPGELFVAVRGDRFDGHDFVPDAIKRGAWGAVVERSSLEGKYGTLGTLKNIMPVEDTLSSLQEMSMLHRKKFPAPVVGITGSNGKTTTKEMLASILRQRGPCLKTEGNLNNHIGVPLTLLKIDASHRSAIIEMGMSGLNEIELLARLALPDVGVITNIGPAHLKFLGSTDRVAEAKAELLTGMRPDGTAVLNADDRYFGVLRKKYSGRIISFGTDQSADVYGSDVTQARDFLDFSISADNKKVPVRLRTVGRHNVSNALAATAAALALGTPLETVKFGLEEFHAVTMRSELREVDGRTIICDYYNANPNSVLAALETLASLPGNARTIAVLGDMLELGDASDNAHAEIGRRTAGLGITHLIAVGPESRRTAGGARAEGMPRERVHEAETVSRAASLLREVSKPGDRVLIKGSRGMKMEKILEEF